MATEHHPTDSQHQTTAAAELMFTDVHESRLLLACNDFPSMAPRKRAAAPAPAAADHNNDDERRGDTAASEPASTLSPEKQAQDSSSTASELNPRTHHYEFGGPVGVAVLTFFLPAVSYGLVIFCNERGCPAVPAVLPGVAELWSPQVFGIYVAWWLSLAVLHIVVPGQWAPGVQLRDGGRLQYKLNGFRCFLITLAVLGILEYNDLIHLAAMRTLYPKFLFAATVFATMQSLLLYLWVTLAPAGKMLALGGNSGYAVYDWFIGKELNPRIDIPTLTGPFPFDFKFYNELRPGMFGWIVIDIGMALAQYEERGYISKEFILFTLMQGFYVAESLFHEPALLTTIDITTDGFGQMLSYGDLAWVPLYALQSRYLLFTAEEHPWWLFCLIFVLNALGYYIFRGSNNEKNAFRRNPNAPEVRHLKYMETKAGSKLLISGWWGVARHVNYLGDWLMGLSWCLIAGFGSPIPYFYAVYFAVLLIHRGIRDDIKCRDKYGEDWKTYCRIVKYQYIPYVW